MPSSSVYLVFGGVLDDWHAAAARLLELTGQDDAQHIGELEQQYETRLSEFREALHRRDSEATAST